jgi:hypothetical protein
LAYNKNVCIFISGNHYLHVHDTHPHIPHSNTNKYLIEVFTKYCTTYGIASCPNICTCIRTTCVTLLELPSLISPSVIFIELVTCFYNLQMLHRGTTTTTFMQKASNVAVLYSCFSTRERGVCIHFTCKELIRHKPIKGRRVRNYVKVNVKLSLYQAMGAHRVVRRSGSHSILTIGTQMAVRLSALRAGRPLPPQESSWYSFLLEAESIPGPQCGWKDKNSTSSGLEPTIFRLVA